MRLPQLVESWSAYRSELLSQVRILVVDDDPDVLQLLGTVLSAAGFAVDTVADAEAAWRQLERNKYELLVADRNLPGESGLSLLQRVRDTQLPVARVLMSTFESASEITEAVQCGAADYFAKPFADIKLVLERLRRVIDRRLSVPVYNIVVDELKAALARGDLNPDEQTQLRAALFNFRERLDRRLSVLIVDNGSAMQEASLRTLNASGIWAEAVDEISDLLTRLESGNGPLVLFLGVQLFDAATVTKLRALDPHVELIGFAGPEVEPASAMRTRQLGASDFVMLGREGMVLLKSRARIAIERARRRRLHLHLVATLYQLAHDRGYDAEVLALLPPLDQEYVKSVSGETKLELQRRRHPRYNVTHPLTVVYVDSLSNPRTSKGATVDASYGGLFVAGDPPPLGTIVMLHTKSGPEGAVVARVVRHSRPDEPIGFGLEYLDTSRAISAMLEDAS